MLKALHKAEQLLHNFLVDTTHWPYQTKPDPKQESEIKLSIRKLKFSFFNQFFINSLSVFIRKTHKIHTTIQATQINMIFIANSLFYTYSTRKCINSNCGILKCVNRIKIQINYHRIRIHIYRSELVIRNRHRQCL